MAVPGSDTAPLNNPDHRAEHDRILASYNNLPRGIITYTIGTGAPALTVTSSAQVLFQLVNIPLLASRTYLLGFSARAMSFPAQGYWYFALNPFHPAQTDLTLDAYVFNVAGAAYDQMVWEQQFTVKQDLVMPLLQVVVSASGATGGAIYTEYGGHMRIEDIGGDPGRAW